jgi:capsular exopolysaccharide synthesis family protein
LEAFRRLRTVLLNSLRSGKNVILISSGSRWEGRSFVAANLALSFAESGIRTLLVDADLRNPLLNKRFGVAQDPGLVDLSTDHTTLELLVHTFKEYDNLYLLTAGRPHRDPLSEAGSDRMETVIREAKKEFGVIILDSSPILEVADALEFARLADEILLLVHEGRTQRAQIPEVMEALENTGISARGAIMNAAVDYTPRVMLRTWTQRILRREALTGTDTLRLGLQSLRSLPQKIRKLFG